MKKTLKLVLPILLIFALLVAGYWFFFQYRVDVTTGLLRDFAESQFNSGRYSLAIRCYRWASALDPGDTDLSMRLAEAYHKSGNYSKTESVLVHAIYDAPEDVRLYEALSKVYVEQDKLLDAQQMLDGVSNPEAQAELAARRPAAPVITPEGAYYSEYISVEIHAAPGDTCCCTADGTYPSLAEDVFDGSIDLPGGQTTLCAVAVGENGLVSPAVYQSYTIAGVIEDVTFRDPALEASIRERLLRGDRAIRTDDLWDIEELILPAGLTTTADLRLFTGMNKLVGFDLGDLDYGFLAEMTELRYLELENCVVTQEALEQIGACPNLEVLILANCGLSDVSPLAALTGLRVLDLSENSIGTIVPLAELAALDELYLGHNALTALPPMRGFKSLRILDLSYNALTYVGAVSVCPTIERLNVSHNRLTSATPFSALKALVWFNGSHNQIADVSVMAPCTQLEGFIMTNNKLTDVGFLTGCANIKEIDIDYNDVRHVPSFAEDCPLETFSAAHNFLEDLDGLAGLPQLTLVDADYNNISSVDVLKDCPALTQVNVYNTNVRSAGELAEKGVVVNFTPDF